MRKYDKPRSCFSSIVVAVILMCSPILTFAQNTIKVSGAVTDDTGQPVIGASVMIKGHTTGVPSDLDGNYLIEVPSDAVLEFSSVGFATVEIPVNGRSVINVMMSQDNTFLDESVVVGYGTQKKGSITGAVAAVNSDDMIKTKSENPVNMLTGRLSGLRVWQKSAEPGSYNASIDIRGMGGVLVIIDGVPREMADFNRLNAADIDNVSILKDAAAAIYGVRGGNGVLLVTTKKGSEGKTKVNYNGSFTFQTPSSFPGVVDPVDAMMLYNEKAMNVVHNGSLAFTDEYLEKYRSGELTGADWNSLMIAGWAPQTQHDLSISGGNEKIQFYTSMGYTFQDSFFKSGDLNYSKYNIRANITAEIARGLRFDLNLSGLIDDQNNPYFSSVDLIKQYWAQGPLAPAYIDEAHTMFNADGLDLMNNPVAMMTSDVSGYRKYNKKTFNG
ncbi:MAG: SusC/RagA family TonB-linked outer membrane protein, partial [Bacteroidales bacterium]|nr:SusC/RagA family TonB-linked outer membrane protein [Bacteroidales bacterium]